MEIFHIKYITKDSVDKAVFRIVYQNAFSEVKKGNLSNSVAWNSAKKDILVTISVL